jgi:AI-2 transport protein TqsA
VDSAATVARGTERDPWPAVTVAGWREQRAASTPALHSTLPMTTTPAPAASASGTPPATSAARTISTPVRVLGIVVGLIVVLAALKLARTVLLPMMAGVFLAVLARPLHCRLRDPLPGPLRWLALVLTMLVVTAGVGAFAAALGLSGRAVVRELRDRAPQIERQMAPLRARAAAVGVSIPAVPDATPSGAGAASTGAPPAGSRPPSAASADGGGPAGGGSGGGLAQKVGLSLAGTLAGLGLALAFAALGLAEADDVRRRIAAAAPGSGGEGTLAAIDEAARAFRRYAWVKTITSLITGAASALLALAFGLPLAWVWGFLAFLLEYVPSVGSLIAVIPPTLMALADGGGLGRAGAVLASFTVMQIILGNVVDPKLEGRLMAISPFGVLLSIVFWGWLWGAVGALLAVPLTVAVVIVCRHLPHARGFATIVAGDGVDDERS